MTARETGTVEPATGLFSGGTVPEPLGGEGRQWLLQQLAAWPKRVHEDRTCCIGALMDMATAEFCRLMAERPQPTPSATGEIERWKAKLLAVATERDRLAEHREQLLEEREQQAATIAELREACDVADKRLCELTPNFPPDVGPDMRDAEEIEKTGVVVMQIRATLERTRGQ